MAHRPHHGAEAAHMIYGLYLSAAGVKANTHRQDVIANNLANTETVGFKRDITLFQQRLTEAQMLREPGASHPALEGIGGSLRVLPTRVDTTPGEAEHTGNPLDVAVHGQGFFRVLDGNQHRLTRDGRFMIDREGHLILANGKGQRVLDDGGAPIRLDPHQPARIESDGRINQEGQTVARLGLVDVPDASRLEKAGGNLLAYPEMARLRPAEPTLRSGFLERANVDPTTELTLLLQTQRLLEANANLIRYQDQTLARLVNDVGRIG
jgi:flagellar basal-body rod protein FlgF